MGAVIAVFSSLLLLLNDQIFLPYSIESPTWTGSTMIILIPVMAVVLLPTILISHSLRQELRGIIVTTDH